MKVGAIWAQAHRGAIGIDGDIPWNLPEDLAHFRRATRNSPIIMGRATWQSLPPRFRPLPQRTNIVLTHNPTFDAPGAHVVCSIDAALDVARDQHADLCWVIGGAHVYHAMLNHCDFAVVTHIDLDVPNADTFAPQIPDTWQEIQSQPFQSTTGLSYAISVYLSPTTSLPPTTLSHLLQQKD